MCGLFCGCTIESVTIVTGCNSDLAEQLLHLNPRHQRATEKCNIVTVFFLLLKNKNIEVKKEGGI
jgi:hypothetical protein